jgi:CubicO group peptidase (beta-lactamase class C family)
MRGALLICAIFFPIAPLFAQQTLRPFLDSIRTHYRLPALAACVIVDGKVAAALAVGVRKDGDTTHVRDADPFHLGSDGKAMTATMLAVLVEQGKLRWSSTIGEIFPELRRTMRPAYRSVTLAMLLAHRAGLTDAATPKGSSVLQLYHLRGTPAEQRLAYVRMMLATPPVSKPGSAFLYSNAGYVIAGAMAERVTGRPYEELMRDLLFKPLGMTTAGFGAMNTPGRVDAPWQHVPDSAGGWRPIDAGPYSDNPPALAPAGRAHMSVEDWGKFVAAHLNGERDGGIVTAETFRKLHTPSFGDNYAFGWGITMRPWADGLTWAHAGSNNQNYAVVWAAPKKRFAVLVATNAAGAQAQQACDDTSGGIIERVLAP